METQTYHGKPELKAAFLAEIAKHEAADALIKGTYGQMNGHFKGCAIGCSVVSLRAIAGEPIDSAGWDDHARVVRELGWPLWLAYLEDTIFEQLPDGLSKTWPRRLAEAIPVGVVVPDVVLAKVLRWLLRQQYTRRGIMRRQAGVAELCLVGIVGIALFLFLVLGVVERWASNNVRVAWSQISRSMAPDPTRERQGLNLALTEGVVVRDGQVAEHSEFVLSERLQVPRFSHVVPDIAQRDGSLWWYDHVVDSKGGRGLLKVHEVGHGLRFKRQSVRGRVDGSVDQFDSHVGRIEQFARDGDQVGIVAVPLVAGCYPVFSCQPLPIQQLKVSFRYIHAFARFAQRRLHGRSLSVERLPLEVQGDGLSFVGLSLLPSDIHEGDGRQGDDERQPDGPPLGRRFALTVGLCLSGLFIAFRDPDNGRSTLGPDQYLGFGLFCGGLAVLLGTLAFSSTWGWWL